MSIASTGEYETPNSINGFDEASGEIINLNSATHSSNGLGLGGHLNPVLQLMIKTIIEIKKNAVFNNITDTLVQFNIIVMICISPR
jgi:hypothetical protein